jgi:hypothetical protein
VNLLCWQFSFPADIFRASTKVSKHVAIHGGYIHNSTKFLYLIDERFKMRPQIPVVVNHHNVVLVITKVYRAYQGHLFLNN